MTKFLKDSYSRFTAQTPTYFKNIRNSCIGIGALGTGLLAASTQPHVHLPAIILNPIDHMITIGVVGGLIAQLTKTDNNQTPPPPPPTQNA